MRRPKGTKTRKPATKRFKITGKVLVQGAGRRHLMNTKNAESRRRMEKVRLVNPTDFYRIKQNLLFSH